MQVAAVLSDLNSLSVCPAEAATALVTVHKKAETGLESAGIEDKDRTSLQTNDSDPDLSRANKLISLHYNVKVKHLELGHDTELLQARRDVDRVVAILNKGQ